MTQKELLTQLIMLGYKQTQVSSKNILYARNKLYTIYMYLNHSYIYNQDTTVYKGVPHKYILNCLIELDSKEQS